MADIKRVGILTGGGDCPGLNAVIRAVAKPALNAGLEVYGIEDGYLGLIEDRIRPLTYSDVSDILTVGGTILGSCNKANPADFSTWEDGHWVKRDVRDKVVENACKYGLDVIFVIGGDGTMSGASDLIDRGIRMIGVPKTIDNDLCSTEITFGHNTAVNTATEALDKVHTTASSHHRVMVVELMGRYAGWLTLNAGLASGSDVILIPEIPFDINAVAEHCMTRSTYGKRFTIIAAGEGATEASGEKFIDHIVENSPDPIRLGGVAKYVASKVEELTGLDTRSMVLGHVQRGGSPTPRDRILASCFGYHAFELLKAGRFNELVVMNKGELSSVPIKSVANRIRTVPLDHPILATAKAVGTSFGVFE